MVNDFCKRVNYIVVKCCIITFNWESLVVILSIVCEARYAISDCLVIIVLYSIAFILSYRSPLDMLYNK